MDEQATRNLLRFAEEAGRGLRGLDANLWRDWLQHRYQDLEAAFGWLLDHGRCADALAVASTLAEFLTITGRVAAARSLLDRVLAADTLDDRLRAVALYEDGLLALWQGAGEEACSLHGRSLHLARRVGDHTVIALALGLGSLSLRAAGEPGRGVPGRRVAWPGRWDAERARVSRLGAMREVRCHGGSADRRSTRDRAGACGVAGGAVAGDRPGSRPADGAHVALLVDRCQARRSPWPGRAAAGRGLLCQPGGVDRLPRRLA